MPLTPRKIVSELDRHIVGQPNAKKSVAIALRNRWRRQNLQGALKNEILPKNILMIGPTGVGKTEISRRLAKLSDAPFIKIEATKFTEVGYVGRDVEQIVRDLLDIAIHTQRQKALKDVQARAAELTTHRLVEALSGKNARAETREKFEKLLKEGSLDDREIEIEVLDAPSNKMSTFEIPGMPGGQMGMMNLGDLLGKGFSDHKSKKKMTVKKARKLVRQEESDSLVDEESILQRAIDSVENNGIVFLDEIDKICAPTTRQEGGVSREGVQRDLLPIIEGTNVSTKHGNVKTDHILFVASGAFHVSKPADLLPELQGRLPIRVEMDSLTEGDFIKILTEPEASLIQQYVALLETEGVTLSFKEDAIQEIASLASKVNESIENIGARRLHTVMEKVLEDISFHADERRGDTIEITAPYVRERVGDLAQDTDLSKFIL